MKRYLDVRYDVTDLTEPEVQGLWGEAQAQAESSERHPDVEAEIEIVEHPDACSRCGRDGAGRGSGLCASCSDRPAVVVSLSGGDVLDVVAPRGSVVEVRQYHADFRGTAAAATGVADERGGYWVVWPSPDATL